LSNDVRYPDLELFLDWNESGNQSEKLRAGRSGVTEGNRRSKAEEKFGIIFIK